MRPLWQMIMFLLVSTLLWSALHYYLWRRLVRPAALSERTRNVALGVLAVSALTGPIVMIVGRVAPPTGVFWNLRWLGFVLLGFTALAVCFTLVRDVMWWATRGVNHGVRHVRKRVGNSDVSTDDGDGGFLPVDPDRRQFLFNASSAGVLAGTSVGGMAGYVTARRVPPVREIEVPVEGLHPDLDGFTIAQLSDVHVGPTITREDLEAMVETINALEPDLVAVTGDLVDGLVDDMFEDVAPIADLRARHGVYYCTGNHEYYWDGPAWCEAVAEHGLHVLNNSHDIVERGDARLLVAGVTDYNAERHLPEHASDPHAAMDGAPDVDYRIALAHQPRSVHDISSAGFDLQLSGHTHGGQFFPLMLFVGLAHPFTAGLHLHDAMHIFVTTGAGYWGPPQRLGVPSELPLLTLRRV